MNTQNTLDLYDRISCAESIEWMTSTALTAFRRDDLRKPKYKRQAKWVLCCWKSNQQHPIPLKHTEMRTSTFVASTHTYFNKPVHELNQTHSAVYLQKSTLCRRHRISRYLDIFCWFVQLSRAIFRCCWLLNLRTEGFGYPWSLPGRLSVAACSKPVCINGNSIYVEWL